ncbi:MAG: bifunctional folylpolyglutamate synthase/dihydrofolate synthase [Ruminococcaceae bacterium]|nr:bifunctional folylpolyglutamate synthase/dihydrofolate synthase [Oscillospiraceae bacterium]
MMTYQESMAFIHSVEWQGSRPGLSRITELLARLGNPEKDIKVIHVAGTNGKGSFCAMLESVLRHAGYRTGLFVSPYLEQFEERIQADGSLIDSQELAAIVSEIAPHCRAMSDLPTEFEILTAIGFTYFKKKKVDLAVVECGMGGRLDSTNVIPHPLLSVITGISLDHTQFLGDTIEKIAAEKAGIIKTGHPVLYGGKNPDAARVIAEVAAARGSTFATKDFDAITNVSCTLNGTTFCYRGHTLSLPLLGAYQPENAASVWEAVSLLRREGLVISDEALHKGLATVRWKGRFEKLNEEPTVIFDGGHNEEGVTAAVRTVRACFGDQKLLVISGVMKDKDYHTIASEIATIAHAVYTVTPANPRALPSHDYAAVFGRYAIEATPCQSFEAAVTAAFHRAKEEHRPLLCVGSLYAYGDFKQALNAARLEDAK